MSSESGFQYDATRDPCGWWSDTSSPPVGEWQSIYRNGGPRDGYRMGTAYPASAGGWEFTFGRDEHGELLPGFAPEAVVKEWASE